MKGVVVVGVRVRVSAVVIALLSGLSLTASAAPGASAEQIVAAPPPAGDTRPPPLTEADPSPPAPVPDAFQQSLDGLVAADRFPGVIAAVQEPGDGGVRDYTAGVGDLVTGEAPPVNGYVRIGSNTKTFTAVVVMQLVAEGKVELRRSIEWYLPGVVPRGKDISVRQLLQHTSGLPNYTEHMADEDFDERRHVYRAPVELLKIAFAHGQVFPPGAGWQYSNTGYVLLGLMIERITGRPVATEITARVIDRLGLRETYFPAARDESMRAPHPRGYEEDPRDDVTESDPSWAWSAGAMIATPRDLNTFFRALLIEGRLVGAPELAEMRSTVDTYDQMWPGVRYGLGLTSTPLSCGGVYWGHGGDVPGFETRGGVRDDGRAAHVAVTAGPDGRAQHLHVVAAVDRALCG